MAVELINNIKMGLDTTHNAWHGPYSAFNRFRTNLMDTYNGTNLNDYQGYGGDISIEMIADKGLYILFSHSDCDGEISASDCKLVSDSLKDLIPKMTDEYLIDRTNQFANGCLDAFTKNETLEFN